eukprot:COSAG02_NODE_2574_length_8500_cov_21.668254_9_plen_156_part_00
MPSSVCPAQSQVTCTSMYGGMCKHQPDRLIEGIRPRMPSITVVFKNDVCNHMIITAATCLRCYALHCMNQWELGVLKLANLPHLLARAMAWVVMAAWCTLTPTCYSDAELALVRVAMIYESSPSTSCKKRSAPWCRRPSLMSTATHLHAHRISAV